MPSPRGSLFVWSLHACIGGFIGGAVGFFVSIDRDPGRTWQRRYWRIYLNDLLGHPHTPTFIAGSALLGVGIVSYFGERLLFGRGTLAYSNSPPHSSFTRWLSVLTGASGLLLVAFACLGTR